MIIIYQFNQSDMDAIELLDREAIKGQAVPLETQPYGQKKDKRYHFVVTKTLQDILIEKSIGRKITDSGRTPGYWQNLGGSGVYRAEGAFLTTNATVAKIVKGMKSELHFQGKTWQTIINQIPLAKLAPFQSTKTRIKKGK